MSDAIGSVGIVTTGSPKHFKDYKATVSPLRDVELARNELSSIPTGSST
jgi:hypothetical protein